MSRNTAVGVFASTNEDDVSVSKVRSRSASWSRSARLKFLSELKLEHVKTGVLLKRCPQGIFKSAEYFYCVAEVAAPKSPIVSGNRQRSNSMSLDPSKGVFVLDAKPGTKGASDSLASGQIRLATLPTDDNEQWFYSEVDLPEDLPESISANFRTKQSELASFLTSVKADVEGQLRALTIVTKDDADEVANARPDLFARNISPVAKRRGSEVLVSRAVADLPTVNSSRR